MEAKDENLISIILPHIVDGKTRARVLGRLERLVKDKVEQARREVFENMETTLSNIFHKEGQPILIMDAGGYKGEVGYYLEIGKGRIRTERYTSIEELLDNVKPEALKGGTG